MCHHSILESVNLKLPCIYRGLETSGRGTAVLKIQKLTCHLEMCLYVTSYIISLSGTHPAQEIVEWCALVNCVFDP